MLFHLWASLRANNVEGWPPEKGRREETVQVTSAPQPASVHRDSRQQAGRFQSSQPVSTFYLFVYDLFIYLHMLFYFFISMYSLQGIISRYLKVYGVHSLAKEAK